MSSSSNFTVFNRKERKMIAKKSKTSAKGQNVNWRAKKNERRIQKEKEFLDSIENGKSVVPNAVVEKSHKEMSSSSLMGNQKKWYSLAIALPGSILNNTQSAELRSYVAGEIARTCAIFCVDEVVIFDETSRMTQMHLDAYYSGSWADRAEQPSESNIECNFYLAKIMEYLECPQYLRKSLFPMQKPLKYAGLLNPLDAMHHLRADNFDIPYREGVILNLPKKKGQGLLCDVGLDEELRLSQNIKIPAGTRVTVKISTDRNADGELQGTITSPRAIRKEAGLYWGYKIRLAKSLSDVFSNSKYDFVIDELEVDRQNHRNIIIVFGGLGGLEIAVDSDEEISQTDPADYFSNYVNSLVDQGSRIIRTEEAIPITLTSLKGFLNPMA
uniref:Uncharacterized protein n=1 Tax=Ditylenchus dipsaci TaxID=166011 RepID=A0A915CS80_9BILA